MAMRVFLLAIMAAAEGLFLVVLTVGLDFKDFRAAALETLELRSPLRKDVVRFDLLEEGTLDFFTVFTVAAFPCKAFLLLALAILFIFSIFSIFCEMTVLAILCSVYFFLRALTDSGSGLELGNGFFFLVGLITSSSISSPLDVFCSGGAWLKKSSSGGHRLVPESIESVIKNSNHFVISLRSCIPLRQRNVKKSSVLGHSPFFKVSGILTFFEVGPDAVEELDEPLLLFLTLIGELCKAVNIL